MTATEDKRIATFQTHYMSVEKSKLDDQLIDIFLRERMRTRPLPPRKVRIPCGEPLYPDPPPTAIQSSSPGLIAGASFIPIKNVSAAAVDVAASALHVFNRERRGGTG